ncbi:hypothetical protein [Saccharothrix xinjiangensis]|uniref:Amino acid permease-like protein n=1 Tax=Saccharothrix xinjiangensis TaxID=204798 RepID=A0ABV9XY99_9PSEU
MTSHIARVSPMVAVSIGRNTILSAGSPDAGSTNLPFRHTAPGITGQPIPAYTSAAVIGSVISWVAFGTVGPLFLLGNVEAGPSELGCDFEQVLEPHRRQRGQRAADERGTGLERTAPDPRDG